MVSSLSSIWDPLICSVAPHITSEETEAPMGSGSRLPVQCSLGTIDKRLTLSRIVFLKRS